MRGGTFHHRRRIHEPECTVSLRQRQRYKHCCGQQRAATPLRYEALAAQRAGLLRRAEALYRRALGENPADADSLQMLGVVQLQRLRYREALELLWRAAEQTQWAVPAIRHNVGIVLSRLITREANVRQAGVYVRECAPTFEAFVRHAATGMGERTTWNELDYVSDAGGRMLLDFIGRYETLQDDVGYLRRRLGLAHDLPHTNRSTYGDYRQYYTSATGDIVAPALRGISSTSATTSDRRIGRSGRVASGPRRSARRPAPASGRSPRR